VFNSFSAYSSTLTQPGVFDWKLGAYRVQVLNGNVSPATPSVNTEVYILRKKEDGKFGWFSKAVTDANGLLKLDLPETNNGQVYLLKAKSPVDGSTKYGPEIRQAGDYQFTIGSQPLQVTFVNDESNQAINEVAVTTHEVLADGSLKWVSRKYTDNNGQVSLDLPELGSGKNYQLKTKAFSNFTYHSQTFTQAGKQTIRLGKVRVAVTNGNSSTLEPLKDAKIVIHKKSEEEKFKWYSSADTDSNGQLLIDLPDLDTGAEYKLSALSTITGKRKYSGVINKNGSYEFTVGNPALNVLLVNALSDKPLTEKQITVYRLNEDNSKQWISKATTDNNGQVVFDLDGISEGIQYVLTTTPYNGGKVESQLISQYGDFKFSVGATPVTLLNKETNLPLTGKTIIAYRVKEDGGLDWYKRGNTDDKGQVIFDLSGLNQGQRYVLKTINPFGENKRYYSSIISAQGTHNFAITKGETNQPDTELPTLTVTSPVSGTSVPANGFEIIGTATDNQAIDRLQASISSANNPEQIIDIAYNATNGTWQVTVAADLLVPEQNTVITVSAYDNNDNMSSITLTYSVDAVIPDTEAPIITLSSHSDGDEIAETGVILSGEVTDDIGVTTLTASVTDPVLGQIINNQTVAFDATTGRWELVIRNGQMTVDQIIQLNLTATDGVENETSFSAQFTVVSVDHRAHQMLGRLTFGTTPEWRTYIEEIGPDAFLLQQLNPSNIDDSDLENHLADFSVTNQSELKVWALLHMLYSNRQLQEIMTQFWDNHFNTDVDRHGVIEYEVNENNGFRQHALGYFRDLLDISAKSPAMIIYLNNAENVAGAANENYARELMELHTLGVDGGYDATDIAELARIFTGWHVQNGQFFFNSDQHDFGDKQFLGQTIIGSGQNEAEQALDILALHPSTAAYVCNKLAALLVSESPNEVTLNDCKNSYLSTNGHIGTVVQTLVNSIEFSDENTFRNKVKTPLEMVTSVGRNFNTTLDYDQILYAMIRMGMDLFDYAVPTGWSEDSEDWINSNLLLQRSRFVNDVAFNTSVNNGSYIDVIALVDNAEVSSAEAVVSLLFDIAYGGDYTDEEFQIALSILNENTQFNLAAGDAETKLRRVLAHIMSFPTYQFQ
jgi:uncharacterized protein (DUF1800 family)/5-hydroxyisourate hydrolase-like protein (transthyretin family)